MRLRLRLLLKRMSSSFLSVAFAWTKAAGWKRWHTSTKSRTARTTTTWRTHGAQRENATGDGGASAGCSDAAAQQRRTEEARVRVPARSLTSSGAPSDGTAGHYGAVVPAQCRQRNGRGDLAGNRRVIVGRDGGHDASVSPDDGTLPPGRRPPRPVRHGAPRPRRLLVRKTVWPSSGARLLSGFQLFAGHILWRLHKNTRTFRRDPRST